MRYDPHPDRHRRTAHNRRHGRTRRRERRASRADATDRHRDHCRRARRLRADGSGQVDLPAVGKRVRDRDDDSPDPDRLIVVAVHRDTPARDYYLETLGATVADVNPVYDPDAPVIDAVYPADAEEYYDDPGGDAVGLAAAVDSGAVTAYSFPADRLERVDDDSPGGEHA